MKKYLKIILLFLLIFSIAVAKKYNRVASINLSGDEMILNLISSERIVGLSGKINEDKDMSNVVDLAKGYPKIENNIETLLNLEPDLVIGADWIKKETLQQIEESGVESFIYKTPKTFQEQKSLILELATILEEREKGEKIVEDMERRLEALQEKIKKCNRGTPKILLYTALETTSGKGTTFDEFVKLIGGVNLISEMGVEGESKISKERVIELDPEIIIVPIWSTHLNSEEFFNFVMNDDSFQEVRAVKNKQVYGIPYKNLSPTSQYMIDGIENLGRVVYKFERESL